MATHDYVIANGTGAAVRSDLNNALAAIVSNNSSSSAPGTTYAYQWWADTNTNKLKLRNSANNGWITLRELDGTLLIEDGSVGSPGLAFADDLNTGIYSPSADSLAIATAGVQRVHFQDDKIIFNQDGNDVDFRVESNNQTHMFFVDAGNDRIGIGASSPNSLLHLATPAGTNCELRLNEGTTTNSLAITQSATETRIRNNVDHNLFIAGQANGSSTASVVFETRGNERFRISETGRLFGGTSSALVDGNGDLIQIASSAGGNINLGRDDSTVSNNNNIGKIRFWGNDANGTYQECAQIACSADGNHGNDDKPSRLEFKTTADGASSPTERMRITSDGKFGFNTTNPGSFDSGANNFVVLGNTSGTGNSGITIASGNDSYGNIYFGDGTGAASYRGFIAYNHNGNTLRFGTDGNERMRITSTGTINQTTNASDSDRFSNNAFNLLHNDQDNNVTLLVEHSGGNPYGVLIDFSDNSPDNNTNYFLGCADSSATRCLIYSDGDLENHDNSYGGISDEKLKQDIVDAGSQWDDLKGLRVRKFKFKSDVAAHGDEAKTLIGLVAQEAEAVCPGLVKDNPDLDEEGNDLGTVTKSVRYSVLYMKAIKALQEAQTRIETLESQHADLLARVAALEAG